MEIIDHSKELIDHSDSSFADAETQRAIRILQHAIKQRKIRMQFAAIVDRAKAALVDIDAIEAGAQENKFYSVFALVAREQLKSNNDIQNALNTAWRRVISASKHFPGNVVEKRGRGDRTIKVLCLGAYRVMLRKLYLAIKEDSHDAAVSPDDCFESLRQDWMRDSEPLVQPGSAAAQQSCNGAQPVVSKISSNIRLAMDDGRVCTEQGFARSWFELADVHVDSVRAEEYCEWIYKIIRRITVRRVSSTDIADARHMRQSREGPVSAQGSFRWRSDDDLLDALCKRVQRPKLAAVFAAAQANAYDLLHEHSEQGESKGKKRASREDASGPRSKDASRPRSILRDGATGQVWISNKEREVIFRPARARWQDSFGDEEARLAAGRGVSDTSFTRSSPHKPAENKWVGVRAAMALTRARAHRLSKESTGSASTTELGTPNPHREAPTRQGTRGHSGEEARGLTGRRQAPSLPDLRLPVHKGITFVMPLSPPAPGYYVVSRQAFKGFASTAPWLAGWGNPAAGL